MGKTIDLSDLVLPIFNLNGKSHLMEVKKEFLQSKSNDIKS